jgi:hypothetical protein
MKHTLFELLRRGPECRVHRSDQIPHIRNDSTTLGTPSASPISTRLLVLLLVLLLLPLPLLLMLLLSSHLLSAMRCRCQLAY